MFFIDIPPNYGGFSIKPPFSLLLGKRNIRAGDPAMMPVLMEYAGC